MSIYKKVSEGSNFSTEFSTYILAFCPDTDSWFVTNKRFFYYEYPMEFPDESSAIEYFKKNAKIFLKLEENELYAYRPDFYKGGVYLDNINEFIPLNTNKNKVLYEEE